MKQEVCSDCGWKGKLYPDGTLFAGPGGTLSCPNCQAKGINGPFIEGAYGNVDVATVPPIRGWKIQQSRRNHLIHYFIDGKTLCKQKVKLEGGEYIIKEHWTGGFSAQCLRDWEKEFCPKCDSLLIKPKERGKVTEK